MGGRWQNTSMRREAAEGKFTYQCDNPRRNLTLSLLSIDDNSEQKTG